MSRKPNSYVADAIVNRLASGLWPSEEDAAHLIYASEIPRMRLLVSDDPRLASELLQVASTETGHRAAFFLALLRYVAAEAKCAQSLRDLFLKNCDTYPVFACHLIWRLLDDPELPLDWHQTLFKYVLDHWDSWKRHSAEFEEPGPRETATVVESRLGDPTFPASKKWIYLLCLPDGLAADLEEARRIVERETGSSDNFRSHVAQEIARRFWK